MQQLIIQRRCCHTLLITLLLQPLPHIPHAAHRMPLEQRLYERPHSFVHAVW
jgi:hypothetical protein